MFKIIDCPHQEGPNVGVGRKVWETLRLTFESRCRCSLGLAGSGGRRMVSLVGMIVFIQ